MVTLFFNFIKEGLYCFYSHGCQYLFGLPNLSIVSGNSFAAVDNAMNVVVQIELGSYENHKDMKETFRSDVATLTQPS